jgi:hypothetical protein
MDVEEILAELSKYRGYFPRKAVEEAIRQQTAITPRLLRALEDAATYAQLPGEPEPPFLPLYAIHLLAQFRERRAYPLIAKLCRVPGMVVEDLLGETIAEGLPRILATVFDGDMAPIRSIIENEAGNEWVRGAAVHALGILGRRGIVERADVIAYFGELFHGRLERKSTHVWNDLAVESADLHATILADDLREAFDEGLIDPGFIRLADIEDALERGEGANEMRLGPRDEGPIDDAIAEMEWWACFHPEPRTAARRRTSASTTQTGSAPAVPVRCEPKIGRNAPCPCGSGKKYKKCCGAG